MQAKTQTLLAALMVMAGVANSHGVFTDPLLAARDGGEGTYFSITEGTSKGPATATSVTTSTSSSVPVASSTTTSAVITTSSSSSSSVPVVSPSSSTSSSSTTFMTVTTATTPTTTSAATPVASSTSTTAASSPSPNPGSGSGSGSGSDAGAGGLTGPCTAEGMFNCIGGTSYQQCASGAWSKLQNMPSTTKCQPGQTMALWARDMGVDGRGILEGRRRGY
ncbi:hypothetical protein F5Y14DRAFT_414119 [Nemania sp. NC0429]|nr:hypothetical protein F5Y14DRAFT_414119 [Nemania sp. NC0429]